MPTIRLTTVVEAPVRRVFDLARDVDRHTETMAAHDERAVGGVTSGRLEAGDVVTWRARHVGVPMELTVEITEMDPPRYFRDEQTAGPFAEMVHEHRFDPLADDRTEMTDEFTFRSPAGPLGAAVDRLFLERYMRRLLGDRTEGIKEIAERDDDQRTA